MVLLFIVSDGVRMQMQVCPVGKPLLFPSVSCCLPRSSDRLSSTPAEGGERWGVWGYREDRSDVVPESTIGAGSTSSPFLSTPVFFFLQEESVFSSLTTLDKS